MSKFSSTNNPITTYDELAKREGHILMIATDLDEDRAELAESSGHLCLETAVLDTLREASVHESVKNF